MSGASAQPAGIFSRLLKKALITLLALPPLFVVLLSVLAAYLNVYRPVVPGTCDPSKDGMSAREVSFLASDGMPLSGWIIKSRVQPPRGAVLVCHGVGANRDDVLPRAKFLTNHGYDCFLFDFRCHGKSGGHRVSFGYHEVKDIRAALDVLLREVPGQPIALFAQSMGAATAVLAAGHCPEVCAFILDSCFTDLWKMAHRNFRAFPDWLATSLQYLVSLIGSVMARAPVWSISPEAHLTDLANRPVLFIHGAADEFIPPEHSKRLYAQYGGPKELLLVPGAPHVSSHKVNPQLFESHVVAFLDRLEPFHKNPHGGGVRPDK
jgi:fermentation-respiration switch protein FrsA (DUF1100 family)